MRTMLKTRLRPMIEADIPQIMDIERESFPAMWPQTAYKRELSNKIARYLVLAELRDEGPPPAPAPTNGLWASVRRIVNSVPPAPQPSEFILGFIGIWLMVDEAHIVTIASRPERRREGIGERLLIAAVDLARDLEQYVVTLEVRSSNVEAQAMYEKYGFARVGLRKRYYTDNNEDAVLMTTPDLATPAYQKLLAGLREQHRARHPDLWP